MPTENRLLDDLARVASGAFSALSGVREDIEARLREQFENILAKLDLVTREEFEAVKAMASLARVEQESLAARIAALEARFGPAEGSASAAADEKATDAGIT